MIMGDVAGLTGPDSGLLEAAFRAVEWEAGVYAAEESRCQDSRLLIEAYLLR